MVYNSCTPARRCAMVDLWARGGADPHFLIEEYGVEIYNFCRRITFSKEDGEDLFQDTFLKILEKTNIVVDGTDFRRLLYLTALTCWKDRKRKYARRARIVAIVPLEENLDLSNRDTEEELLDREERLLVRELVNSLPEKYRGPTVLYYGAEMKIEEISRLLSLPVGTVKNRLFTARQMVKKGLKKYDKEL